MIPTEAHYKGHTGTWLPIRPTRLRSHFLNIPLAQPDRSGVGLRNHSSIMLSWKQEGAEDPDNIWLTRACQHHASKGRQDR
jgi:hypothetical protein